MFIRTKFVDHLATLGDWGLSRLLNAAVEVALRDSEEVARLACRGREKPTT